MPLPYVQTDHRLYEDSLLGHIGQTGLQYIVGIQFNLRAQISHVPTVRYNKGKHPPLKNKTKNNTLTLKTTTTTPPPPPKKKKKRKKKKKKKKDTFHQNSSLARVYLGYFNTHQCNHKVHREESRSQEARSRIVNLVVRILGFFAIRTDDFYTRSPRVVFTGCLPRVVGFTYSFLPCINGTTT